MGSSFTSRKEIWICNWYLNCKVTYFCRVAEVVWSRDRVRSAFLNSAHNRPEGWRTYPCAKGKVPERSNRIGSSRKMEGLKRWNLCKRPEDLPHKRGWAKIHIPRTAVPKGRTFQTILWLTLYSVLLQLVNGVKAAIQDLQNLPLLRFLKENPWRISLL